MAAAQLYVSSYTRENMHGEYHSLHILYKILLPFER
jgi:hypothetical protein